MFIYSIPNFSYILIFGVEKCISRYFSK